MVSMLRHLLQLVCMVPWLSLCHSLSKRTFEPPYSLSFHIDDVTGSARTNGPMNPSNVTSGSFYNTLVIHDDVLYVGGESQLFTANLGNLTMINNVTIPHTAGPRFGVCKSCQSNFVRIIQPLNDDVFLECGTNANRPYCRQRSFSDLAPLPGSELHFGLEGNISPSLHNQNSSWLLLNSSDSTYEIYSGTYLANSHGYLKRPAITKTRLTIAEPRTKMEIELNTKSDSQKILNDPQFVGNPILYNGRLFFFYREIATEHINGGRIIFSRVATICQNDQGGMPYSTYTQKQFVTFAKARLNCSVHGRYPYHYNEIRDVYQSTVDERVVFAVFSTGPSGVASSAVCAYRLDDIESLFHTSPFRSKQGNGELWTRLTVDRVSIRPVTCPATKNYTVYEYREIFNHEQLLHDLATHRLQYDRDEQGTAATQPTPDRHPLLVTHGERFTRIVVRENVNKKPIDVMFLGTENGTVLKAYLDADFSQATIVEEISLTTEDRKSPVLSMILGDECVYAGTDSGVFKVPLQHCEDYGSCRACLGARDPYCRWAEGACRFTTSGLQNLKTGSPKRCPKKTTEETSERIIMHRWPRDQWRLVNQSVRAYILAEAAAGSNLRLKSAECEPCGQLPFSQFTSACSGRELLVAVSDGPLTGSHNASTCKCDVILKGDSTLKERVNFQVQLDDSDLNESSEDLLNELSEFTLKIQKYKYELRDWKIKMAKCKLGDQNLQDCPSNVCS